MKNVLKKVLVASLLTTAIYPVLPINVNQASANSSYIGTVPQPQYKTIATSYLSKQTVKDLAANMKRFSSNSAMLIEAIVPALAANLGPVVGGTASIISLATALSINSQLSTEVLYAASHNMRVKVEIQDLPYHTSYSTRTIFTAVY
ncbi:hypothetical protein [Paenibacillus xylanexedens]|uniref:hypothetical protein n=1 Tax=Paenibacillus xylanexedens TaxID=528191 RepID=UPI00119C9698|nr:hypothetical protein [Paenibacillus xylanexedens]